jgi:hypothetical protein
MPKFQDAKHDRLRNDFETAKTEMMGDISTIRAELESLRKQKETAK